MSFLEANLVLIFSEASNFKTSALVEGHAHQGSKAQELLQLLPAVPSGSNEGKSPNKQTKP